jgi:hypothetical protein
MLRPNAPDLKVYLHRTPIDMRRGRNGLAAIVREVMQQDPFQPAFFLFINKRFDALKILTWDINGFGKPSTKDPRHQLRTSEALLPMAPLVRS